MPFKTTRYFDAMRERPDRCGILDDWILSAIHHPIREQVQEDGRLRRWARIDEAGSRFLHVVLLPDGHTVPNAFFDRRFTP